MSTEAGQVASSEALTAPSKEVSEPSDPSMADLKKLEDKVLLGYALGSARAGGEPTSAPATRSPVTQPAPPSTSVVVRPTASSACLETARRGDQIIHLLLTNRRNRAADLLVAYTVASRQCRRDASP